MSILRAAVVLAFAVLPRTSPDHAEVQPPRGVELVVHSAADPKADILVDPAFRFLGRVSAPAMNDRATFEQYWFVRADARRITHMVIVHFERWKDDVAGSFDYPTFRLRRLGDHDYLHQSFPMEAGCGLATAAVRALVRRASLELAKECIGTRFVRTVTADKRSELILFYVEPVDVLPSLEGLGPGGLPVGFDQQRVPETPWLATDRRLTEAALRAIRVRDRP